jgi:ATP-dependent Zn protease
MSWQVWQDLFVSWFPMLLLLAVWIFFMRQMRGRMTKGQQHLVDTLVEQRRHNEVLEKMLAQYDARLRKLEGDR